MTHRTRLDRLTRDWAAAGDAKAEAAYRAAFAARIMEWADEVGIYMGEGAPMTTPEWWAEVEADPDTAQWAAELGVDWPSPDG